MQNLLVPRPASPPDMSFVARYASGATKHLHPRAPAHRSDHQFIAMLDSYRDSGGIARASEVVAQSRRIFGPDAATLSSWITTREVLCFEWQWQTWLPLFQFSRVDMRPQPELGQLFAELTPVYDPWELANWFAQPNPWLSDRIPVDTFLSDLPAVLEAARADRFVASG